jgi:hypothetical protein
MADRTDAPERRFTDAEVAAILERASTAEAAEPGPPVSPAASPAGLTLAQLQDIGREVGIAPRAIADAALALAEGRGQEATTRRFLGLPLGVQRTVQLDRRLSEEDWERVVAELREVFDARGRIVQEGSLRQWTNGNLHAYLEPSGSTQRLRLRTVKGNARGLLTLGAGVLGAAAATAAAGVLTTGAIGGAETVGMLAAATAAGAALLGGTALRLGAWARERREQMATVAARVAALDRQPPSEVPPPRLP